MPNYSQPATSLTPALIIYLLDVSGSMDMEIKGRKKIDMVAEALKSIFRVMMRRSMKGEEVAPRYGLSMIAYSSGVADLYNGVVSIADAMRQGLPALQTFDFTYTDLAFQGAFDLLNQRISSLNGCPAPMVCHLTDGQFSDGHDPRAIVQQIMSLQNDDGPVLVENIYVGEDLTAAPITNAKGWTGILDPSELTDQYAQVLFEMSSPLPESYAMEMQKEGYSLQPGARMLIPADSTELVQLAFAMSSATRMA